MNLRAASDLVVETERQSFPEFTYREAIEHVTGTLTEADLDADETIDPETAQAYRMVIRAYMSFPFPARPIPGEDN